MSGEAASAQNLVSQIRAAPGQAQIDQTEQDAVIPGSLQPPEIGNAPSRPPLPARSPQELEKSWAADETFAGLQLALGAAGRPDFRKKVAMFR